LEQVRNLAAWARLGEARVQAHWAVQVVAAAGQTLVPHTPDTSHTALQWDAGEHALCGRPIAAAGGACLGLRLEELALAVVGPRGERRAELALPGRTLAEAMRWAGETLSPGAQGALMRPPHELPMHPLEGGAAFQDGHGPALAELARLYAQADLELRRCARSTPGAGEVLCWPHHFDLALLFELERDAAGRALRTVGAGFSPGDEFFAQPYWYANHWPETRRAPGALPPLAAGEWFTEGWSGAVLRADALVAAGAEERELLRAFLDSALAANGALAREAPLG